MDVARMWVRVLEPYTDKLLFRYDPFRDIIEIQRRGVKTLVDLQEIKAANERPDITIERQGAPE